MKKGQVVRCPWREFGDDANLTGEVIFSSKSKVVVRWHGNGTVTPAGDESTFKGDQIAQLEIVP